MSEDKKEAVSVENNIAGIGSRVFYVKKSDIKTNADGEMTLKDGCSFSELPIVRQDAESCPEVHAGMKYSFKVSLENPTRKRKLAKDPSRQNNFLRALLLYRKRVTHFHTEMLTLEKLLEERKRSYYILPTKMVMEFYRYLR